MDYKTILKPLGIRRVLPIGKRLYAKTFSLINGAKPIVFRQDTKAVAIGTVEAPFTLTHGGTFIVNTKTMTAQGTAGTHVSGASPAIDITGLTTPNFKISADGDPEFHTVTLATTDNDTGPEIAAEMQTKIRAIGGVYATITVAYTTVYTITSGTKGTGSKIRIADGDENNVADDLKIGTANGGTNNDGTGNVVNLAAVTIPEMIAMAQAAELTAVVLSEAGDLKIGTTNGGTNNDGTGNVVNLAAVTIPEMIAMAQAAGLTAVVLSDSGGKLKLETVAVGKDASLVVGAGTLNTALGFSSGTTYGAQGFYGKDMPNTSYKVFGPAGELLTVSDKTTSGFTATHDSTEDIDVIVIYRTTTGPSIALRKECSYDMELTMKRTGKTPYNMDLLSKKTVKKSYGAGLIIVEN